MSRPTIAVTLGDPGGIGPEVLVKALADEGLKAQASWRVLGLGSVLRSAAQAAGVAGFSRAIPPGHQAADGQAGGVLLVDYELAGVGARKWEAAHTREGGEVSLRFVHDAIDLARAGGVAGVVTGPISKAAWALAGEHRYHGHTELFGDRLGSPAHAMMFASPVLNVILVSGHLPLRDVPGSLTTDRVLTTIRLGHAAMGRLTGKPPRIAVCGLNPHAGEEGVLGSEDGGVIAPAIRAAGAGGMAVTGPCPADTIFSRAVSRAGRARDFDLVVAMYHDQGLIPLKLLARDQAVNLTVGLPIVRTSPDHGTAFDIAGRNAADPGSMRAALEMAVRLAGRA